MSLEGNIPTPRYLEPPKELYDKFDEFLGLLLELHKRHKELYEPIAERVAVTIDSIVEVGGFRISSHGSSIFVGLRLGPNKGGTVEDLQVLTRTIRLDSSMDPMAGFRGAISVLQTYCDQLNASKIPEPEVLLVTHTPHGNRYAISGEWITWYRNALPFYPIENTYHAASERAANKHFRKEATDRIEWYPNKYSRDPSIPDKCYDYSARDFEIVFYRVIREKL